MKILVATGGTPQARLAIAYAGALAEDLGGSITLLCIANGHAAPDCEAVFKQAAPLLAALEEYHALVRHGHAAEQILRETEEQAYDLLVIGARGGAAADNDGALGDTAESVAARAGLPVLIVKGDPETGLARPLRNVLAVVSGAETAGGPEPDAILRHVAMMAGATAAQVTVLHVLQHAPPTPAEPVPTTADVGSGAREGRLIEYSVRQLRRADVHAEALMRRGDVVDEVLAEAAAHDYDLLVIGGRSSGQEADAAVQGNAMELVRRAAVPTLVINQTAT